MDYYKSLPGNCRYYNHFSNFVIPGDKFRCRIPKVSSKKEKKERLLKKKIGRVIRMHSKENLDLGHQDYGKLTKTDVGIYNPEYRPSVPDCETNFSYITKSKKIDDVEPVFGFNAVASYGPTHAGLTSLQSNKYPRETILKSTKAKRKAKKQVRFSDRLVCRQFVRTEEERELDKINYKKNYGLIKKFLKRPMSAKPRTQTIYPEQKVAWYLESEYSLSNVSGLYPEEIAALKAYQTFCVPRDPSTNIAEYISRNLATSPIPEEDEQMFENTSSSLQSLIDYGSCSDDKIEINEKAVSLESIPATSIDSGFDNSSVEDSMENLKLPNQVYADRQDSREKVSLLDGLFLRAQTSVELKVAESLKQMNLPDWALNGLFISENVNSPSFQREIPSIMMRSDNLDHVKSTWRQSGEQKNNIKIYRSLEDVTILPRFLKTT